MSPWQLETTAAAEVAKSVMRIVSDTVDLNFFLLDEGVRKYQSPASRPNLTSPLSSVRVATTFANPSDQRWQAVYEQLKNTLPEGLQKLLAMTLELPVDQRGAHVMVLDALLQATAQSLVLLSAAADVIDADSLPAARAEANLFAPYVALVTGVFVDRMLLSEAFNFLSLVGPNDPNFTALAGYMGQFNAIASDVEAAAKILQDPTTFKDGVDKLGAAASTIAALSHDFDSLYGGSQLLLLGPILHASADVTAALCLEKGGAGALLISLAMANVALADDKSQASGLGLALAATLGGVSTVLGQLFVPKGDMGSQLVLNQLVTSALAGAILFGTLTYAQGLPIAAQDTQPEVRAEKVFAYGLALSLLSKMDVISSLAGGIAAATNLPAESQEKVGSLLSTAAMLLLIAAAAKGRDLASLEPLIADQRLDLKKGIEEAAALVSKGLTDGTLEGGNWEMSNVYLQQAAIALADGDGAAFIASMGSVLGLGGISNEGLLADISSLSDFAMSTLALLQASADEIASNCTGIYSPA